ncbi:putative transcriptional regulator, ModE family [Methanobacterium lacus]|jgi:molybdate transport system regulatory protein|uniref:Putative transcriptional regulator, ModE family n=1 Tax=Methanobacterium lacus (strain AL-21) TaxID=877455 RepID=F0T782_METLA|nr:TOBE domain-containing protein [Methanobacterium lacus]ADZ10716.1 putative transcriptional regulator, ModE family [Methanobacterium lacus]
MDRTKNGPQYRLKFDDKIILLNKKKFNLLENIDECGSIMKASKKVNIPYRSALKYIEELENESNKSIVSTQRGGKGGGGESKLTENGKSILKEYRKVESILKMHDDVNEIESNIVDIDQKNKIANIKLNNENVVLPLRGNFEVGDKVLVLISPEDVFVMLEPQESSVRNIFPGKIIGMELKNHLVRLNVDTGEITLFVDVTEYSREKLNLTLGKDIYIGFKAAAIAMVKI